MRKIFGLTTLCFLGVCAAPPASAHIGLEPQAIDVMTPPGQSLPLDLETTFGLFRSDDGEDWRFTCHEALLAEPSNPSNQLPVYARTANSLLVALQSLGLGFSPDVDVYRSTDGGCDWSPVSGLTNRTVNEFAVLADGTTVIVGSADISAPNGLFFSTDGGGDFDDSDTTNIDGLVLSVAAGPGQVVWATSLAPSGVTIWRSEDAGATWTSEAFDFDAENNGAADVTVVMADDTDPLVAWIGVSGQSFDYVYRTADGGQSFTEAFRTTLSVTDGVAGDPNLLAASGGRPASSSDGTDFELESGLPFTEGVGWPPSGLHLATSRTEDFALVRVDGDDMTPLMAFGDVFEQIDCPAGTRHALACGPLWDDALAVLDIYRNIGDDDDSGGDGGDDDDDTGCDCGSSLAAADRPIGLALLALPLLAWRRRR